MPLIWASVITRFGIAAIGALREIGTAGDWAKSGPVESTPPSESNINKINRPMTVKV